MWTKQSKPFFQPLTFVKLRCLNWNLSLLTLSPTFLLIWRSLSLIDNFRNQTNCFCLTVAQHNRILFMSKFVVDSLGCTLQVHRKKNVKEKCPKNWLCQGLLTVDAEGRVKPGRVTGPPCTSARECFSLVEARERRGILDEFNAMADSNIQNVYLQGLIVTEEPEGDKPRVFKNYFYYAQTSDMFWIQVCLEFCSILKS